MSIQRAANHASVVAVGTIKEVGPARWNTPDGQRPTNPHRGIPGEGKVKIFQVVTLEVQSYLKGNDWRPVIPFVKLGGQIGQDFIKYEPNIAYQPGQRIVVFLNQPDPENLQGNLPNGIYLAQRGRYLVQGDVVVDGYTQETMPFSEFAALVANADTAG